MPHAEPPRKISMAYILGLSPHPFKETRPSFPPPRFKESNPFVNMMTTPGAVLEWAASDGRKGKLSTQGPPKLTSRNLAKVPSEKPIGRKTASTQANRASKEQSRKKDKKEKKEGGQDWGAAEGGWGETKSASATGSKRNKKDEATGWGETGGNAWQNDAAARSTESKGSKKGGSNGSKKDDSAAGASWGDNAGGTAGDTGATGESNANANDAQVNEKKDEGNAWEDNSWGGTPNDTGGDTAGGLDADATNAFNTDSKTIDNAKEGDKAAEGSSDWSTDQDTELMKLKSENVSMSWETIAEKLGKGTKETCKTRFNEIKPKDWKPQGKGNGGGGKKDKGKSNKNNHTQEKEVEKEKEHDVSSDSFLGGGLFGNFDMDGENGVGGGPVQSPVKASGFDTSTTPWAANANTSRGPQTQQQAPAANDLSSAIAAAMKFPANQALNEQLAHSSPGIKPPTPYATSKNHSHHSSGNVRSHDTFHDIYPDTNFSQQEILVLAKILKDDHQLLWNRVASRFRDKTGRDLHPGTFEEKVTGRSRRTDGSERGGRMGGVRNWRG
jgi:hypothetical protein